MRAMESWAATAARTGASLRLGLGCYKHKTLQRDVSTKHALKMMLTEKGSSLCSWHQVGTLFGSIFFYH
jgi:hypothetical protein